MTGRALRLAGPLVLVVLLLAISAAVATGGTATRLSDRAPHSAPSAAPSTCNGTPTDQGGCSRTVRQVDTSTENPVVRYFFGTTFWLVTAGVVLVLLGLLAALAFGMVGSAGVRLRRREPPQRPLPAGDDDAAPGDAARLAAAIAAGLADLADATTDPRRAVIATWVRLEAAAARAGTVRRAAETPGDLVQRVLAAHAVTPHHLTELAQLYREARYSAHVVDANMRADARRLLDRLQTELTMAVTG